MNKTIIKKNKYISFCLFADKNHNVRIVIINILNLLEIFILIFLLKKIII